MASESHHPAICAVSSSRFAVALLLGVGWACLAGVLSPPQALAAGMALALLTGNPHAALTRVTAHRLLQISVVALGFSMDLHVVGRVGLHGFWFTAVSIALGAEMSAALGTVFLLNAAALYLFPLAGHHLGLDQTQFGTWAGAAIHDISSVVGAAAAYGHHALRVATAVKLSRALWIVPVTLLVAMTHRLRAGKSGVATTRITIPWFIGLFLLASTVRTLLPAVAGAGPDITAVDSPHRADRPGSERPAYTVNSPPKSWRSFMMRYCLRDLPTDSFMFS
ncbi:MAG: putative sulfate exporter family transporter [Gammaproteobacteria bacterium]